MHYLDFPIKPRNIKSLSTRKPLFGVGINDADYLVYQRIDNKAVRCPIYTYWGNMLKRCYLLSYVKTHPAYTGCTVHTDWHLFSNFRKWFISQHCTVDVQLDKDIIVKGNKVYSADTCALVSQQINVLFNRSKSRRGNLPVGVKKTNGRGRGYMAICCVDGKDKYIGTFGTIEEASQSFLRFKANYVLEKAQTVQNINVRRALIRTSEEIGAGTFY